MAVGLSNTNLILLLFFCLAVFLAPLKTFQQNLRPRKLKMSLQIPAAEGLFNGQNLIFVHFLCNETFLNALQHNLH